MKWPLRSGKQQAQRRHVSNALLLSFLAFHRKLDWSNALRWNLICSQRKSGNAIILNRIKVPLSSAIIPPRTSLSFLNKLPVLHANAQQSRYDIDGWQRTEWRVSSCASAKQATQTKASPFWKEIHTQSDTWVPRRAHCQIFIKNLFECKREKGEMLARPGGFECCHGDVSLYAL